MRREFPVGFVIRQYYQRSVLPYDATDFINETGQTVYCFRGVRAVAFGTGRTDLLTVSPVLYLESNSLRGAPAQQYARKLTRIVATAKITALNFVQEMEL